MVFEKKNCLVTGKLFFTLQNFVEDNKDFDEYGYPLRPIALVNTTTRPTQKVDWLISQIIC